MNTNLEGGESNRPTRRPILIGQAEEIPNPNIRPEVHAMLDNEGLYICGDTKNPLVIVPLWSQDGIVQSMKLDKPLDPERFLSTVTLRGPFTPDAKDDPGVRPLERSLAAANERMERALGESADELGNVLFRFDTVVDALRQAVLVGGKPLSEREARENCEAMLASADGSRQTLRKLTALLSSASDKSDDKGGAKK